jgi:hypothetical protein
LPSDRDLLRRFIYDGDEASFAAIVERHSSLVMSVCRRVVGQSPDVDDAFQATFFALSQRPASILRLFIVERMAVQCGMEGIGTTGAVEETNNDATFD